jgi:hypothetical protein
VAEKTEGLSLERFTHRGHMILVTRTDRFFEAELKRNGMTVGYVVQLRSLGDDRFMDEACRAIDVQCEKSKLPPARYGDGRRDSQINAA